LFAALHNKPFHLIELKSKKTAVCIKTNLGLVLLLKKNTVLLFVFKTTTLPFSFSPSLLKKGGRKPKGFSPPLLASQREEEKQPT
jgi:hypothetical protein